VVISINNQSSENFHHKQAMQDHIFIDKNDKLPRKSLESSSHGQWSDAVARAPMGQDGKNRGLAYSP
jgi:hypothetical protein